MPKITRLLIICLSCSLTYLLIPLTASAFCGFFVSGADSGLYNDATQVVLMRKGSRTVMSMSNTYRGPMEDFAMVVPVPVVLQKKQVKTLPHNVFKKIDQLSAPRLVEYWERDPCSKMGVLDRIPLRDTNVKVRARRSKNSRSKSYGVTVEAQFTSGEYQVVILSAKEANGLEHWLKDHKYSIPKGASAALKPYIQRGMKFFVAKVDITQVKRDANDVAVLSPLRFDYESKDLRLPVRLGLLNASGQQDLLIYILSPQQRYEVANYKNVFIPTNLEVEDVVRTNFGGFYTKLFEEVLARHDNRAVITEYAWQTTSCDPCPVPPLDRQQLLTLGGEVFQTIKPSVKEIKSKDKESRRRAIRALRRFRQSRNFQNWVLTRLHTRYSRETLSEDLVFVPAKPVRGGRGSHGRSLEKAGAVDESKVNQFQGRYIIRNYWEGEVTCESPKYGIWGGPNKQKSKAKSAGNLGRSVAAEFSLNDVVRSQLKRLKIKGKPEPKR